MEQYKKREITSNSRCQPAQDVRKTKKCLISIEEKAVIVLDARIVNESATKSTGQQL